MTDRCHASHRCCPVSLTRGAIVLSLPLVTLFAAPGRADAAGAIGSVPAADPAPALPCLPTDPFCAAGTAAGQAVADVWISAMTALWNAGLWLLSLAFRVVDSLTTPDLSQTGPLGHVYPVTFGLGAAVAVLMSLVQLGRAALRRDGRTLARLFVGVGQYGLVWAGYVGIAALLVTGMSGLTRALLKSLLHVDSFSGFHTTMSVNTSAIGGTEATVLGVCSLFLLVPSSVGYLLLMLVREAALMVLAATSPIAAGGLLAESTSAWFWKSLRWFLASLLMAPLAVLVLGVGVGISSGVVAGDGSSGTGASIGMAVVGCLLVLVGAVCPLLLFRLLAFVDPGTPSGATMRQSLAASGGLRGLVGRAGGSSGATAVGGAVGGGGGAAAAAVTAAGRSQGEATAEETTGGRFVAALGGLVGAGARAGRLASDVAGVASDVLAGAGVGHPTWPYLSPTGQPPARDVAPVTALPKSNPPDRPPGRPSEGPPPDDQPAVWADGTNMP